MTGDEFRRARLGAALSVRKAAAALGVAPSTIQRWEADEAPIPSAEAEQIAGLAAEQVGDTSNTAYLLGRLYAVIETVFSPAEHDYRQASTAPAIAYGPLLARVIAQSGSAGDIQAEITELVDRIPATPGFPRLLNVPDQGAWALGYYHRKAGRPWPPEDDEQ